MSDIKDFVIENGVLTRYVGNDVNVVIPEGIIAIGDYAFNSWFAQNKVKSIIVPDGVKTIGNSAFAGCSHLKKLNLPNDLAEIGEDAFKGLGPYSYFLQDNLKISGAENLFMSKDESWYLQRFDTAPIEMWFGGMINKDAVAIKYFKSAVTRNKKTIFSQIINHNLPGRLVLFLSIRNKISEQELDSYIEQCRNGNLPELTTILLDYKNKHHSEESCAKLKSKKTEQLFDVSNVSLTDWKTVFKISTVGDCATISGYKGMETTVIIPEFVGEYKVTKIAKKAFCDCKPESVTLPSGITEIEDMAFMGCSLKNFELPSDLKKIGKKAFTGCGFSKIIIPDGVKDISDEAFWCCENLEEVTFPADLTRIGKAAFCHCEKLKKVTFPEGLTHIGIDAFSYCTALEEVRLPTTVTDIARTAFFECENLKSIYVPANVPLKDPSIFYGCDDLTVYGTSGSIAEKYCKKHSLHFVADDTLSNVIQTVAKPQVAEESKDTKKLSTVAQWRTIYKKIAVFDKTAKLGKYVGEDKEVEIPAMVGANFVVAIDELAFFKNKTITRVVIPEGVTQILRKAFADCSSLAEVVIPDSMQEISYEAFKNCSAIKLLKLNNCFFECDTFKGCKNLESLTINDNSLKSHAFVECKKLTDLYCDSPKDVFYWGNGFPYLKRLHLTDHIKEFKWDIPQELRNITIYAPAGSYAETYAKENNIHFVAEE